MTPLETENRKWKIEDRHLLSPSGLGRKEMTQLFFQTVRKRRDTLYVSDLVLEEVDRAPDRVRFSLMTLVRQFQPLVLSESRESLSLAQEYVVARVIPASSRDDARHVAIATLAGSEALVSWNLGIWSI
jgi:hypothetical protein